MTLGYVARAVVQMAVTHLLVSTIAAIGVAWAWRIVAASSASPGLVAGRLFVLRLLPSAAGSCAALLVGLAYGLWEAGGRAEGVGAAALVAAAAGACLGVAGLLRVLSSLRHTRLIRVALARTARTLAPGLPLESYTIESPFPVVALVGFVAPRLFVARTVVEACSADEFSAVVAHEMGHARQRDNLRRLALVGAPDVLGMLPIARRMHDDWAAAAELAADEWATTAAGDGLPLASALVKVARLATSPPISLSASALYDGEPIAARVDRLVNPPAPVIPRRWPASARMAAALAAAAAALASLPLLHEAAELLLRVGLPLARP